MFFAKDFIETAEGLIFAVVERGVEDGKALCFLRYVLNPPAGKISDC
jgi:predicted nucleotidyltransferase